MRFRFQVPTESHQKKKVLKLDPQDANDTERQARIDRVFQTEVTRYWKDLAPALLKFIPETGSIKKQQPQSIQVIFEGNTKKASFRGSG